MILKVGYGLVRHKDRCGNCCKFVDERNECWETAMVVFRYEQPCNKYRRRGTE